MSVQKKSLISQRSAVKSAILATPQSSTFTPATRPATRAAVKPTVKHAVKPAVKHAVKPAVKHAVKATVLPGKHYRGLPLARWTPALWFSRGRFVRTRRAAERSPFSMND